MLKSLFYRIVYNRHLNYLLRNVNKIINIFFKTSIRIPPSGQLYLKEKGKYSLKLRTNQTSYVTFLLFWENYKNFEYTKIFIKLIKKINVFFDIGANLGYYSLIGSWYNPELRATAFEPATGPCYYLRVNKQINGFDNLTIVESPLSNKIAILNFNEVKNTKYSFEKYDLSGENTLMEANKNKCFVERPLRTLTLDMYLLEANIDKIDLIKLDTEGSEFLILQGGIKIISKQKPIIICETLYNVIEQELESFFLNLGYDMYNHFDHELVKVKSIIRSNDDGVRNCFFVHPSKYHLIQEFVKNEY